MNRRERMKRRKGARRQRRRACRVQKLAGVAGVGSVTRGSFFEEVWRDAPEGGVVYIGSLDGGKFLSPEKAVEELTRLQGRGDQVFSPAVFKTKAGCTKENCLASRCAWVEIDLPGMTTDEVRGRCTLPPSYIVATGEGSYDLYWLLEEWCYDGEKVERFNKWLLEDIKGE